MNTEQKAREWLAERELLLDVADKVLSESNLYFSDELCQMASEAISMCEDKV